MPRKQIMEFNGRSRNRKAAMKRGHAYRLLSNAQKVMASVTLMAACYLGTGEVCLAAYQTRV